MLQRLWRYFFPAADARFDESRRGFLLGAAAFAAAPAIVIVPERLFEVAGAILEMWDAPSRQVTAAEVDGDFGDPPKCKREPQSVQDFVDSLEP